MATARRRSQVADSEVDDFLGTSNIVPGEVLLTLEPGAAADMTASVPTHPAGPVLGLSGTLGLSDLDAVLADLGAHDITRLAVPAPDGAFGAGVLGQAHEEHLLGRSFRVRLAQDADVADAVARLDKVDSVEVAEPNRYRVSQDVTPNDPSYPQQWGLGKINAPAAWSRTTGSASVVVGVIDSGIDLTHPELAALLVPGFDMVDLGTNPTPPAGFRFEGDFSGRDSVPTDEVGHGTHVAGTIAALSNNGVGVAGVAWQCRIMPIKALTRMVRISDGQVRGVGTSADIAAAIRWAADNGASVVNMSLGSNSTTTVEASAIAYAVGKGVVVVAAMGNDGSANPSYPAAYPDVISVGATDSADQRASFSQTGAHIDLVAPGVNILSTVPGGYGSKSGTSMATPHVAGVAALIRSVKPTATVAEVTDILRSTARPLRVAAGDPIPNDTFGWGLVDAAAAVDKARPRLVLTARPTCDVPQTIFQVRCGLRTIRPIECLPPRTVVQVECLPRTALPVCNIATVAAGCPPPFTTTRTITPRTITIQTVTRQPIGPAAYDPYGYLGAGTYGAPYSDSSGVEEEAAYEGEGSDWDAGYQAGYLAAIADLQSGEEGGGEQAPDAGGAEWAGDQGLFPKSVLVVNCIPLPKTLLPHECLPVPTTITRTPTTITRTPTTITRTPTTITRTPTTITRTPTTITRTPTTFPTTRTPTIPTTFPTTTNPPTTPFGGVNEAQDWSGYDPYGQTPFQG